MKRCPKCATSKKEDGFSKDRSRKDGLDVICKTCRRYSFVPAWRKKWNELNPERRRSHHRLDKLRHPEQQRARAAVRGALAKGVIKKPEKCFDCQNKKELIADHFLGYERKNWLKVQFVCRACDGIRRRKG